jgi:hypothetical protein
VQPVRLELTTNRLKVYCAAIAPRLHFKELQYSTIEYCLCQEGKFSGCWIRTQRSSRYERDEIDLFSNPQKILKIKSKLTFNALTLQRTHTLVKGFLNWSLLPGLRRTLRFTKPLHRYLCLGGYYLIIH